jgi:hypothetical protein
LDRTIADERLVVMLRGSFTAHPVASGALSGIDRRAGMLRLRSRERKPSEA